MLWTGNVVQEAEESISFLLARKQGVGWGADLGTDIVVRELVLSTQGKLIQNDVYVILDEMHHAGEVGVAAFEARFANSILPNRPAPQLRATAWEFFLPFGISCDPGIPKPTQVVLLGQKFLLSPQQAVFRKIGQQHFQPHQLSIHIGGTPPRNHPPIFINFKIEGRTWDEAWTKVEPAFAAFRGLVEYVVNYRSWRFGGTNSPRAKVPHPYYMLFRAPGVPIDGRRFIYDEFEPNRIYQLNRARFDAIRGLAKRFPTEAPQNSTARLVADAFRLFAQAMDARFAYSSFLGLWQLLEAITRSEVSGGHTEEVRKRVAWHAKRVGFPGSGFTHHLKLYASKRNAIVHRGMHDVDDEDVNVLKAICEISLGWLMNVASDLPTLAHLDAFYSHRTVGFQKITALRGALSFIESP